MQENDGVSRAEIILDSPLYGVGALIAEIYGDGDLALGAGGGSPGSKARRRGLVESGGRRAVIFRPRFVW